MKLINKKYLLGFGLLACLIVGAFLWQPVVSRLFPDATASAPLPAPIGYPAGEAPNAMWVGGGITVYAQESPSIVIGEVKEVGDPYFRKVGNVVSQQNVVIDIKEVIKGDANMKSVTLVIDGGKTIDGEPVGDVSFKQGEKVLLFFGKTTLGDYIPIGGPNGKYLIDANNNVTGINGFSKPLTDARQIISDALKVPYIHVSSPSVPYSGEVSPTMSGGLSPF